MSKTVRWIVGLIVLGVVIALLAWAFVEGRKELAVEREREMPVKAPSRVSRSARGETIITLDAATQQRIGLKIEALAEIKLPRELIAYGSVVDPAPLVALEEELSAAKAALAASKAEIERLRALRKDETVSQKALDAAEAQLAADKARFRIAQQKLSLAWCEAPLPKGTAALVLVDLPSGQSLSALPKRARVSVLGHEDELPATVLCAERKTEPETQGQGFWLAVDSPSPALRPGVTVTAYLEVPGEPRTGVVIPPAAIVRAAGKTWVYEPIGDDRFVRREVALDQPATNGWFCATAIRHVVVVGAQTLLSEEMKSQIQIGEGK